MSDSDVPGASSADYCRLLAACYYQPEPAFAEERMFESMASAGAHLGPAFADDARALAEAFAAEEMQALTIDYTRLFIGPVDRLASPYEAAWLGREGASPLVPVLAFYAEGGFALSDDFLDLPDHVAAELEFLYLVIFRAAEAASRGDVDGLSRWESLERRFLATHLGAWAEPFRGAMVSGATTAFYRVLGDATLRFVRAERERLG